MGSGRKRKRMMRRVIKRSIDIFVAIVGLVVLTPLFIIIALACLLAQGRPILHGSHRAGRGSQPFPLFKFRTMTSKTDDDGNLLPDEQRMTRVGRFLRASSLDETPQLYNILRGDMSLVGPRPLPLEYISRYSSYESRRLKLRPGLTGLAQVQGRNAMSWQRRFAYDVTYVERWTWRMEVRILIDTVKVVVGRHGVSHETHATMPEFRGTSLAPARGRHLSSVPGGSSRGVHGMPSSVPHVTGLELLAIELETSVS